MDLKINPLESWGRSILRLLNFSVYMQTAPSVHFTYEAVMVSGELVRMASEAQQAIQVTSPHGYGLSLVAQENILECTRHCVVLCCEKRHSTEKPKVQKPEGAPGRSQVVKPELLLTY